MAAEPNLLCPGLGLSGRDLGEILLPLFGDCELLDLLCYEWSSHSVYRGEGLKRL